jgi:hypothetical protein
MIEVGHFWFQLAIALALTIARTSAAIRFCLDRIMILRVELQVMLAVFGGERRISASIRRRIGSRIP